MSIRNNWKLGAVALSGLAIGAGASAITSAGAATSTSAATTTSATRQAQPAGVTLRRLAARTVDGDLTVATKSGFVAVTFERGFVQSVNGQQLAITEGTRKTTYKTVTLTIPAAARVRDNGKASTLADLSAGQHVLVIQGPERTLVRARNAAAR
jgi:hypothetical protein